MSFWTAQWIQGGPQLQLAYSPSNFTCGDVVRATMYMSGLGWGLAYINSQPVDNRQLDVGWTRYDKRVLYSMFDVTDLVCPSASGPLSATIEVELGGGHFAGNWYTGTTFTGQLLLQMVRILCLELLMFDV